MILYFCLIGFDLQVSGTIHILIFLSGHFFLVNNFNFLLKKRITLVLYSSFSQIFSIVYSINDRGLDAISFVIHNFISQLMKKSKQVRAIRAL
jgi:hypothetical protein